MTIEVATDETGALSKNDGVAVTIGVKGAPILEGHAGVVETQAAAITTKDCINASYSIKQAFTNFIQEKVIAPIIEGAQK